MAATNIAELIAASALDTLDRADPVRTAVLYATRPDFAETVTLVRNRPTHIRHLPVGVAVEVVTHLVEHAAPQELLDAVGAADKRVAVRNAVGYTPPARPARKPASAAPKMQTTEEIITSLRRGKLPIHHAVSLLTTLPIETRDKVVPPLIDCAYGWHRWPEALTAAIADGSLGVSFADLDGIAKGATHNAVVAWLGRRTGPVDVDLVELAVTTGSNWSRDLPDSLASRGLTTAAAAWLTGPGREIHPELVTWCLIACGIGNTRELLAELDHPTRADVMEDVAADKLAGLITANAALLAEAGDGDDDDLGDAYEDLCHILFASARRDTVPDDIAAHVMTWVSEAYRATMLASSTKAGGSRRAELIAGCGVIDDVSTLRDYDLTNVYAERECYADRVAAAIEVARATMPASRVFAVARDRDRRVFFAKLVESMAADIGDLPGRWQALLSLADTWDGTLDELIATAAVID